MEEHACTRVTFWFSPIGALLEEMKRKYGEDEGV